MIQIKNTPVNGKEFVPRTFSDLIDNFFNENLTNTTRELKYLPGSDIIESEKEYKIQIALPGLKKEQIKIELLENKLSVSGERKFEKQEGVKYHSIETQYGVFRRSFYVPEKVNIEGIQAEYVDGILEVTIPKDEKKISRTTIEVK